MIINNKVVNKKTQTSPNCWEVQEVDNNGGGPFTQLPHLHSSLRSASSLPINVLHVQPNNVHIVVTIRLCTSLTLICICSTHCLFRWFFASSWGMFTSRARNLSFILPLSLTAFVFTSCTLHHYHRLQNYNLHFRYIRVHNNHVITRYMY